MSQEQQDTIEEQAQPASVESEITPEVPASSLEAASLGKKHLKKKGRLVNVEEVMPRSSIWPLIFAIGLALLFVSVLTNPIVLGVAIIVVIVSVFGLILERR